MVQSFKAGLKDQRPSQNTHRDGEELHAQPMYLPICDSRIQLTSFPVSVASCLRPTEVELADIAQHLEHRKAICRAQISSRFSWFWQVSLHVGHFQPSQCHRRRGKDARKWGHQRSVPCTLGKWTECLKAESVTSFWTRSSSRVASTVNYVLVLLSDSRETFFSGGFGIKYQHQHCF